MTKCWKSKVWIVLLLRLRAVMMDEVGEQRQLIQTTKEELMEKLHALLAEMFVNVE
jgi:hypothetical protein